MSKDGNFLTRLIGCHIRLCTKSGSFDWSDGEIEHIDSDGFFFFRDYSDGMGSWVSVDDIGVITPLTTYSEEDVEKISDIIQRMLEGESIEEIGELLKKEEKEEEEKEASPVIAKVIKIEDARKKKI